MAFSAEYDRLNRATEELPVILEPRRTVMPARAKPYRNCDAIERPLGFGHGAEPMEPERATTWVAPSRQAAGAYGALLVCVEVEHRTFAMGVDSRDGPARVRGRPVHTGPKEDGGDPDRLGV